MTGGNLFLAISIWLVVITGILLSKYSVKDVQKRYCPYCSCKDCCKNGQGVEQKCEDEELRPFVCGGY